MNTISIDVEMVACGVGDLCQLFVYIYRVVNKRGFHDAAVLTF